MTRLKAQILQLQALVEDDLSTVYCISQVCRELTLEYN